MLTPISASQSSTYIGNERDWGAANCIDGNSGPGKMCHTQNDPYPWLALDVGKTFVIERVEIFNRHDCCGERTRKVEVRVSEELPTSASQKFSGGSLLGGFAGPGTDGEQITISGGNPCYCYRALMGCVIIRQMDKWQICHSPDG